MGREHVMPADRVHYRWDNSIRPVLEIEPGDVVVYDLREVSDGQISPAATARDLPRLDMSRVYPLAGPIAVKGARPGDALEIEMLEFTAGSWGWSGSTLDSDSSRRRPRSHISTSGICPRGPRPISGQASAFRSIRSAARSAWRLECPGRIP